MGNPSRSKRVAAVTVAAILVVSAFLILCYQPQPLTIFPTQYVGVVEVYTPILSTNVRDHIISMVDYAMKNESIKAVVVKMDSPGGYADYVEEIYRGLVELRSRKPIVVSVVGFSLSGGYYITVAANYTYTLKSSLVGNVGVVGYLPPKFTPEEGVMESGPYKHTGFTTRGSYILLDEVKEAFLGVVESERGSKLLITREELSQALIYLGEDAARLGLIDEVGSSLDAVNKAAELAGITYFTVLRLNEVVKPPTSTYLTLYQPPEREVRTLEELKALKEPPALYYIYLPPAATSLEGEEGVVTSSPTPFPKAVEEKGQSFTGVDLGKDRRVILIDQAHGNVFKLDEISTLTSELASRRNSLRPILPTDDLKAMLKEAEAFIVISPAGAFSNGEVEAVKEFVGRGGRLLLIYDPTKTTPAGINSLTVEFGIFYQDGFLYNIDRNYLNYRNIFVVDFKQSPVTEGLSRLVFFTAASIKSRGNEIAFADENTYLTETQAPDKYSPVVSVEDGKVLALGDQTFLDEQYSYLEDNYRLIVNIADHLSS